jgi:hypothetical protein
VRRVALAVRVEPGDDGRLQVRIDIEMEGRDGALEAQPLAAITDRVLAQQGEYWVEAQGRGVQHRVRFDEDAAAAP